MRTDESCEKDKNQENYKRGNVSRLNILFVFLYFHQEKESEDSGRQEIVGGKKRLKKEKFSAIWTVNKSQCFNKKPRDRFLTKIELKVFPETSDSLFNDCDGMMWSNDEKNWRCACLQSMTFFFAHHRPSLPH
jgi:hypothetical protein